MVRKWFLPFLLLILLSGCSNAMGESNFSGKIDSIEQLFNNPDWKQLKSLGKDLEELYQQNQWKIQLMGDEDEYESLQESINQLNVAIDEQDLTELKLKMASIKTLIEDIYSL